MLFTTQGCYALHSPIRPGLLYYGSLLLHRGLAGKCLRVSYEQPDLSGQQEGERCPAESSNLQVLKHYLDQRSPSCLKKSCVSGIHFPINVIMRKK